MGVFLQFYLNNFSLAFFPYRMRSPEISILAMSMSIHVNKNLELAASF